MSEQEHELHIDNDFLYKSRQLRHSLTQPLFRTYFRTNQSI